MKTLTHNIVAVTIAALAVSATGCWETVEGGSDDTTHSSGSADDGSSAMTVDAACEEVGSTGDSTATTTQRDALQRINCYRNLAGLPPADLASDLDVAADSHAAYMDETGEYSFMEVDTQAHNYTGYDMLDRLDAADYQADLAEENPREMLAAVANGNDANAAHAIDNWMNTVYHRQPLMVPMLHEVGVGVRGSYVDLVTVAPWDTAVNDGPGGRWVVPFPVAGQTGVPTSFRSDAESPDPVAGVDEVGSPISVTFQDEVWNDDGNHFDIHLNADGCSLRPLDGDPVAVKLLEPDNDSHLNDTVVMVPMSPLDANQTYLVEFSVMVGSLNWERNWSFTTGTD